MTGGPVTGGAGGSGGGDALAWLLRAKARGWLRLLRRRLATPSGALFALVGVAVAALWIGSLFYRSSIAVPLDLEPELTVPMARLALAGLVVLALSGALVHRGLYLPAEEIERLFSAPLARTELVRYRLRVHGARALPFGLVLGLVFAPRLPQPLFCVAGTLLFVLTLSTLGQGAAVALGGAETRLGSWSGRLPVAPLRLAVGIAFWALFMGLFFADDLAAALPVLAGGSLEERLETLLRSRWLEVLTLPLAPWALAITAPTRRPSSPRCSWPWCCGDCSWPRWCACRWTSAP